MSQTLANPGGGRSARVVSVVALVLFSFLLALWGAVYFWGDDAALPTLFLFGPRWVVAVPVVLLVPGAVWARSRRALVLALLSGLVVAGPLTGGTIAVRPLLEPERPAVRLRVMTWNMGGRADGPAFQRFLEETKPTLVVGQEWGLGPNDVPKGWTVAGTGRNLVLSRLPVRTGGSLNFYQLGVGGHLDRFVLETPAGEVTLIDLHLPTVRTGIEAAVGSKLRDLSELRHITETRDFTSRSAREWVGAAGSNVIVAGDFNMPTESCIYRRDWGAFRNAFDEAGTGWGTTKQTRWFGVRIDHILYSPPWRCRNVWVGPAMGSDHCPVIADLVREGG